MKKKIVLAVVLSLLIACCAVFAACAHEHELQHFEAKAPTCVEDGWREYWECSICHSLFGDEEQTIYYGKIPTLAATGEHTWGAWTAGEGESCETGGTLRRSCSICGKTEEQIFSAGSHMLEYVEQVPSTCIEAGIMAHWHCDICGKNFADQNAEEFLEDVSLPLGAHNFVDGKCTVCGIDEIFIKGTPGLQYALNEEGTAYIASGMGTATETDIVIASEHNGLPVTSISDKAFEEGYKITSVFIPGSVKSIGEYAFNNCCFLKSVTMEDGVTSIGSYAFQYCSLLTSISIPEGVTSIGDYAFFDCSSLTSITIPNSVTSIGESAFCIELRVGAFAIYCEASSKPSGWDDNWNRDDLPVVWDCNNNDVADDGNVYYASEDNIRYMLEDGEATVIAQPMSLSKVVLPENVSYKGKTYNVTSIIEYAFYYCLSLTSITIPDSITSIGEYAFDSCLALTIYCEASSKPSGWDDDWNSFDCPIVWDCNNNDIVDDGNIYYVSEDNIRYALKDGEAVVVGQTLNLIGEVVLPASVTYNGNTYSVTSIRYAFNHCYALTSIVIPDSVTSISMYAFYVCSSLESIVVEEGNTIYHSEGNCLIETESKTLIAGCKNSIIPSDGSVTSIGESAFQGCDSLTSIVIPEGVTSIGSGAFYDCISLTSITIPDSVTSIGDWAFLNCTFTSITIGGNITSIGDNAFFGCISLTSIVIPDSVTSIGSDAFSGCSSLESIVVEEGNTIYHSEGNCLIETESKTLIAGCKNSIIPSDGSVTSIGESAFRYCRSLTSITIPDSVTSIGDYAFYVCSSLTSITFQGSMEQWIAIDKGTEWNWGNGSYKVICTDGTLDKNDNKI